MKNFDSVPQLQRFSYTCITVLQDRVMAHHSLLQRQLAAVLQCGPAGHGFGGQWTGPAASGPESRTPGVDCLGGSETAVNRIESSRFPFSRIAHHYS